MSGATIVRPTVTALLAKPKNEVIEYLGGIYEHSQWVTEALLDDEQSSNYQSFTTVRELAEALRNIVDTSPRDRKLALLCAHPDLCEKVERRTTLTRESQEEQTRSGLGSLTDVEREEFQTNNARYKTRFGFPFILAVRNATKFTVLAALKGRVRNTEDKEFATALQQVHKIAWMRLLSKLDTSDAQGFLTCHVLDTANGCPAAGMRIQLFQVITDDTTTAMEQRRILVKQFVTNDDGRLEGGPALQGGLEFLVGTYEWMFFVGDYFASRGTFVSGTPFLDVIPLRFGIDNPDDHYHVPLLVSPWSYSTYRGS